MISPRQTSSEAANWAEVDGVDGFINDVVNGISNVVNEFNDIVNDGMIDDMNEARD